MYDPLPAHVDLVALDHDVIEWWAKNRIFARSLEQTAHGPSWTFYEGPPTANGMPGTHHVEARVFKDVFPRYKTMKGYHVPRIAGWDCHGLPVELAVEKELGFTGKPDIEAYGIEAFNAACRENVQRHVDAFETMSERMGYWSDYENAYWTMRPDYVESVWWALKTIFDKGLLVEDYRVAPYCTRCGTGLSDHELAQGYETVVDPSVYVRLPLTSGPYAGSAALLVWTTTPWTLPSNALVAVRSDVEYAIATDGSEQLVVARDLVEKVLGDSWQVQATVTGAEMVGWTYTRPFDLVPWPGRAHFVVAEDYVATDEGTGLVHEATVFGPDDFDSVRRNGVELVNPIDRRGRFVEDDPELGGMFFKDADEPIIADLDRRGVLFRHVAYEHSYPHCWRCHTPLMYYALPSWYVRTTAAKEQLLAENEATNWYPATIKHGRYGDWLKNNIDWALSRDRFWGTPLPVWRNDADPSRMICVGSLDELERTLGRTPRRPAPALRRRHHVHPSGRGRHVPPGAAGDRRLVRLRLDAVRAVRRAAAQRARGGGGLSGRLHLRGGRPDPWLVLLAHGGRHVGQGPQLVQDGAVPRAHPRRRRPQDEQAPRQHPRADPADGPARGRRAALVHAVQRLAVGAAAHRAQGARRDRVQGAAHVLVGGLVPGPVRARQRLEPGAGRRAHAARPQLGQYGPGGRGRFHSEFGVQPLRQLPPDEQSSGPVAGRGKAPQQRAVRRLVERGQCTPQPGHAGRLGDFARRVGGVGEPVKQGDVPPVVLVAGLGRPVVGQFGEQLTATQGHRAGGIVALCERDYLDDVDPDRVGTQPDRRPRGQDAVVADRPAHRPDRGAQVGAGGRRGGVRPESGRQAVPVVRAGVEREVRQQSSDCDRQRDHRTVSLDRELPQQPHPQHPAKVAPMTWRRLPANDYFRPHLPQIGPNAAPGSAASFDLGFPARQAPTNAALTMFERAPWTVCRVSSRTRNGTDHGSGSGRIDGFPRQIRR